MPHSALTALSPLDGRYAAKLAALRPLLSEYGLMHRRVQVEVEWFIALSDAGFAEFPAAARVRQGPAALAGGALLRGRRAGDQGHREGHQPRRQGGRVLAAPAHRATCPSWRDKLEFIHFACTSEDINNTSHALMLKAAREQVLLPAIDGILTRMQAMAHRFAAVPMLSRTHGQTASPTTVGKEVANVARAPDARPRAHRRRWCCWPR